MEAKNVKEFIRALADKEATKKTNVLFEVVKQNQAHITFNRPKMMNAFSLDMYFSFLSFLEKANQMQQIKYIVMKGAGGNFTSGNDLNNFMREDTADLDQKVTAQAMADLVYEMTAALLKSNKPIFALVQGRAIGFGFTQLALYDRVFATENSSFVAPLVKLAQGPEMGSSYFFPKIFGQSVAQQIIIKGKGIGPQELEEYKFLSCHQNIHEAEKALQKHIEQLSQLDWESYIAARRLLKSTDEEKIMKIVRQQCQNLVERWINPDLPFLMMKYLASKAKSPKPKL